MSFTLYDRSSLLNLNDSLFCSDLEQFVWGSFVSDTSRGDLTTDSLFRSPRLAKAKILAKGEGVFCGRLIVEWFLARLDFWDGITFFIKDGEAFNSGDVLFTLEGDIATILRIERTLLNVLQRLSGISTQTAKYVQLASPTPIASTRKTLYGRLDKYAVSIGGGLTHRLDLSDAPMFKDTHFKAVHGDWDMILEAILSLPKAVPFVTVEVRRLDELQSFLDSIPKGFSFPLVLLLDNFEVKELLAAIPAVDKPKNTYFEVSGGIDLSTVSDYAKTGVDVLSVGALTHTVVPVDISLELV
jgi:nicotinate-nucleotide pyrophosphorylase (carboxylating)